MVRAERTKVPKVHERLSLRSCPLVPQFIPHADVPLHPSTLGSERESVKCPIWRGLERLRSAAGCRLARQSLYSEPQIQRWRPVLWGRTFHASRRSWKESSHPIDSSWLGTPARLIA